VLCDVGRDFVGCGLSCSLLVLVLLLVLVEGSWIMVLLSLVVDATVVFYCASSSRSRSCVLVAWLAVPPALCH